MRRREFIGLVGCVAAGWPLAARAQKMPVSIGFLAAGAAGSANSAAYIDAIKEGLRDNGLIESRDYVLEARFAAGNYDTFPELARELAAKGARVLLVNTIASVRRRKTSRRRSRLSCWQSTTPWRPVSLRAWRVPED
jgi:putative tryptophan/tyrosine transport system substrate-binding protein